ncbi:FAD-dependent oxidoreductase [Streptomyces buecherae]|uniref:FAD-dependent oxidoreductase n=1 Tax=Streptomyces buecherae TaxID=2763006 RepID=A0A7H8N4C5_9ACTN|nr:FAD-dependent oxidoreductase [Streptomyces buecherae]
MSARQQGDPAGTHRVVVLGAGYAGLSAATQLAARVKGRADVSVTVVNERDHFTERLRLPMTATGQPTAELDIPGLVEGAGARFVRGRVTALDAEERTVRIGETSTPQGAFSPSTTWPTRTSSGPSPPAPCTTWARGSPGGPAPRRTGAPAGQRPGGPWPPPAPGRAVGAARASGGWDG